MSTSLFNRIVNINNLEKAYRLSRKGKNKFQKEAMNLSQNEPYNLRQLQDVLMAGKYEYGEYNKLYVYEPKERLIHAPQYKDRLVQLAVNNVIKHIYPRCFIYD